MIGHYNWSLIPENMTWRQDMTKTYGEPLTEVTQEKFCKWANWILKKVKDREEKEDPL